MAAADDGGGGGMKAIQAGTLETYDLAADPGETKNLGVRRQPAGGYAQVAGRLPDSVHDRGEGTRPAWTRTRAGGWPALATSVPPRRRWSAATRRGRPT